MYLKCTEVYHLKVAKYNHVPGRYFKLLNLITLSRTPYVQVPRPRFSTGISKRPYPDTGTKFRLSVLRASHKKIKKLKIDINLGQHDSSEWYNRNWKLRNCLYNKYTSKQYTVTI